MLPTSRIAVFSFAYAPFEGGAEVALRKITEKSPAREFHIFTHRFQSSWQSNEKVNNIHLSRLGKGKKGMKYRCTLGEKITYIWRAWRAAEKEHHTNPFSTTWAIMASYGGLAALLFKLRHPRIPLLLTLQEGDSEEHILRRVGLWYPLWKLIFKKADHIQVISTHLKNFALRHGARAPITIVPNGVEIKKYKLDPKPLPERKAGYTLNPHTIITTSRLVYKNGIDTLLHAFKIVCRNSTLDPIPLPDRQAGYTLRIAGVGPLEAKLKILATNLEITKRVEFLGSVPADEIPEVLRRGDIFVRPSRSEGLGSSFLEAMAAGLPIIGTPVGGIPDFLKDEETGLFARVDDPEDLARQIERLLKDDSLRARLIKNGRALVEKNYTWESIAEKMEGIMKNLCAS